MQKRDIILVGTSAGGVEALRQLCRGLPADLPAAVFVVQHLAPSGGSVLPELLTRAGRLPAAIPTNGEPVRPGRVYVAPPDRHMLIEDGRILLRRGPLENRCRPAVDPLFRSAALAYGSRTIGLILTGLLDDGTEGLRLVKLAGGIAVVQDPDDAEWPSMPRSALAHVDVDHCLPLAAIPALLASLVGEPAGPAFPLPARILEEAMIAQQEIASTEVSLRTPGHPSPISCPDCGGVLNEIGEGEKLRYRCQVGHAFTPAGLVDAQNHELERALGVAVRTHRDRLSMFRRMEALAVQRQQPNTARRWHISAAEAQHLADVLEQALVTLKKPEPAD